MNFTDAFILAIFIISYALNIFFWLRNKKQEAMIEAYQREIYKSYTDNNAIMVYCLNHVLKEALNEENYLVAAECREKINEIKKFNFKY